jgi:hypothetical protein
VRGRTHESAARENGQRTRPFADEVRRGLEPGLPANAARRHVADDVFSEEPGSGLGGIARVSVLGQQADERAPEPFVE